MNNIQMDALVIGGGIAGMQAALDLADQGHQVALVEREPSIGGKMITLSKVFPTLDCCSCITTPKMSAVAHHPNIRLFTYCEVQAIKENGAGFHVEVVQKPRYVDESKCTGCTLCAKNCPTAAIIGTVKNPHVIVNEKCISCGSCHIVCRFGAVSKA